MASLSAAVGVTVSTEPVSLSSSSSLYQKRVAGGSESVSSQTMSNGTPTTMSASGSARETLTMGSTERRNVTVCETRIILSVTGTRRRVGYYAEGQSSQELALVVPKKDVLSRTPRSVTKYETERVER